MRRAFRIIAALVFLIGLACAHAQVPMTGAGLGAPASGFTPSCSQSSTFLAAATGVTLTADKTNYDTLICGLVSDGVWNFDVLYIWAAPDSTTALINLANPGTFNGTTHGTVNFTAYQGYTGNGGGASNFYIDSGFNPATATTPNFVQNSATIGAYDLSNRSTGTNMWDIGCTVGACVAGTLFAPYNGGALNGQVNSTTTVGGGSPTSSLGAWNATRVDGLSQAVFLNSAETGISQTSDTSSAPLSANVIFFAFGPGFGWTSDQIAAGWIGKGVGSGTPGSGVNSCKINNRINTYMGNLTISKSVYVNSAC